MWYIRNCIQLDWLLYHSLYTIVYLWYTSRHFTCEISWLWHLAGGVFSTRGSIYTACRCHESARTPAISVLELMQTSIIVRSSSTSYTQRYYSDQFGASEFRHRPIEMWSGTGKIFKHPYLVKTRLLVFLIFRHLRGIRNIAEESNNHIIERYCPFIESLNSYRLVGSPLVTVVNPHTFQRQQRTTSLCASTLEREVHFV